MKWLAGIGRLGTELVEIGIEGLAYQTGRRVMWVLTATHWPLPKVGPVGYLVCTILGYVIWMGVLMMVYVLVA